MHGHDMTFPPARTAPADPQHPRTGDAPGLETTGITVPSFGWTGVAIALHRLQQQPTASIVVVRQEGHLPLVVDVETNAYWWDTPLTAFPAEPVDIDVVVEPKDPAVEASRAPGTDLDALLWLIGNHSFLGELAWWLQRDDRYKLVRWPNFTMLTHTPDQMRMTAMLGYTFLPVVELANASESDPAEARRLINAFSLMRLLRAESPEPAAVAASAAGAGAGAGTGADSEPASVRPAPQLRRGGLFSRLRDRLGL
jgi:hypothetical protein